MLKRFFTCKPLLRHHHYTAVPLDNRALIKVHGDDSSIFLQGLITNDIENLKNTNAIYSMLLNARGRILYDMIIYNPHVNKSLYLIEISQNAVADFIRLLRIYKLRKQVNIEDVTETHRIWSIFSSKRESPLTEPDFRDKLNLKSRQGLIIGQSDPRHSSFGIRLVTERQTHINDLAGFCNISNDILVYKQWLYQNGIAEGTEDIPPGECIPLEYNIVFLNGVSFSKGCYIGQELVARTHHTGVIRKRIMPVQIDNFEELTKSFNNQSSNLTIINNETKRRSGKLFASVRQYGIGLIRLNEWKHKLRIQNADVTVTPSIPKWWPTLDEATKLEMQIA